MKQKFLVLAAVCFSSYAQSQDTTSANQLNDVVITATKFQQKQSTTGKVVSVIDKEMLQRNAGKTITEIINTQTGVFINGANNNLGTNQDVYFRGASSGNTLILIDGVPVGDPSQINNSFDLNSIAVGQIERIEILKGAQSTLWGSDAVAGVINIITKKGGSQLLSPSALLSYGSYNTFRGSVGVNGSFSNFSYNLNYNLTDSKGFSTAYDSTDEANFDDDKFTQNNFQANLGYKISNRFSVKGFYTDTKYKSGIDAGAFTDDKDNTIDNKTSIKNLELAYHADQLKLHLSQTFVSSERVFLDDSTDVGGFAKYAKGNYNGNSSITELYGNIAIAKKLSLISGLQYLTQKTDQDYFSISFFGPYQTALGDTAKATNFSLYNSLLLTDINGFNLEAGFRYNNHNIYGDNTTFSLNPSYNIDAHTKLFVNISSAYKIPSLYQLYSEYGNKNLNPEKSLNYEIGVHATSSNNKNGYRIVAFKRDIKDLIIFYTDANYFSQYINRDEQHDYGFEAESNIALGKIGNWVTNLTYIDGEGENDNEKVRNLYRRPNFVLHSTISIQPAKGLTLSPSFRFVGTRLKGQYDAGPDTQPQYYTIDFYAGYSFAKHFRTFMDVRNITNQKYFDVVGYNSRQLNVMAGIAYNF